MTDYREDAYVKCPYYCKERALDIRCKGMIGLHTTHDFASKADKEAYKRDFCKLKQEIRMNMASVW